MTSSRAFLTVGALAGALAVAAGAFGAHGLRARVTPEALVIFEVGVRYQMYHALALLAVAWAASAFPSRAVRWAGVLFMVGMPVFSGTLYALTFGAPRWLGAVTPIGGAALIGGWLCLAWSALRAR